MVRHGATEWNYTRRAQGTADIELNEEGWRQAREVARQLEPFRVSAVYSSDLKRALHTAEVIAAANDVPVVTDPDLREIDQGEWTGLPVDEIARRWPEQWGSARHYSTRPGGESPADVRRRALAAVVRIVSAHPDETVALVSHGGTIRWLSAEALGYDDRGSARIRGVGNGGVVAVEVSLDGDRPVLSGLARLDGSTTTLDDPND